MRRTSTFRLLMLAPFALIGCGDGAPEPSDAPVPAQEAEAPSVPGTVSILEPQDGSTVTGPDLRVVMDVSGLQVVEAGVFEPGTGHHHIFLNADVTPMDAVIPVDQPGIVHLGLAQTEYVFENVPPGEHRLIAVVADGAHIPLDPPVVDTVFVTVVAP
jgi:hypothetical protein